MKTAVGAILYLIFGAAASYLSMHTLVTPAHQAGGSWDMSPLAGLFVGGPVWLVSFPIIFYSLRRRVEPGEAAFMLAAFGAGALTLVIPHLVRALASH